MLILIGVYSIFLVPFFIRFIPKETKGYGVMVMRRRLGIFVRKG